MIGLEANQAKRLSLDASAAKNQVDHGAAKDSQLLVLAWREAFFHTST